MLLVEYTVLDNLQVINESTTQGNRLKLRGRFQKCDEQNNNGRIYPRKILESQVQKIQEKINDRSLVGALDHPANDAIHLSQASHLITGLSVDKSGDVIGECEILSTPNGKIVEALINDGVKIGISSRGVGSVSEGREGKIVNEDFKLITFDLVSDPSTKGAFPELTESIRENSQRAQEIISKHKKDRVLMTMLESKVSEKLDEATRLRKMSKGTPDEQKRARQEGAEMARRVAGHHKLNRKLKKGKKTTDTRFAQQVTPKKGSGQVGKRYFKNQDIERQERELKRDDNSIDIRAHLVESFKKVCWGNRYNEGVGDDEIGRQIIARGKAPEDIYTSPRRRKAMDKAFKHPRTQGKRSKLARVSGTTSTADRKVVARQKRAADAKAAKEGAKAVATPAQRLKMRKALGLPTKPKKK